MGAGAAHLPKQRAPGAPPAELPRQRRGTAPQGRGRYPDYDVLGQVEHWDQATREVVLGRIEDLAPLRFFDEREARTLRAFCDLVTAQDCEPRIPVLEMVDEKMYERRLDGFRFHDMPQDPDTWKLVAKKLDETAAAWRQPPQTADDRGAPGQAEGESGEAEGQSREGEGESGEAKGDFAALDSELQCQIVDAFSKGELEWDGLASKKAWSVVMRGVLSAFYSHPWAWNEIGFGGPAYPRGFARLGAGQREHWERPPEFEVDPVEDVHERGLE